MMTLDVIERPMAKKSGKSEPSPYVTVKIKRGQHTKLSFLSSAQGRDISLILAELLEAPLDKMYRQEQTKLDRASDD